MGSAELVGIGLKVNGPFDGFILTDEFVGKDDVTVVVGEFIPIAKLAPVPALAVAVVVVIAVAVVDVTRDVPVVCASCISNSSRRC